MKESKYIIQYNTMTYSDYDEILLRWRMEIQWWNDIIERYSDYDIVDDIDYNEI